MTKQEARKKLYSILHDDRLSWTPDSVEALQMAIDVLNDVPDRNVGDMISRQVALKEIEEWISAFYENAHHESASDGKMILNAIKHLPSAQPENVRCKDCKWYELPSHKITENCVRWMKSNGILLPIKPNDYCSYAERRTDAD